MSSMECRFGDLREAAARFGKLGGVRGAQSVTVRNTILRPDSQGLCVDTPHIASVIPAKGRWREQVVVDCPKFSKLLERTKKVWADIGGDDARVLVCFIGEEVTVTWQGEGASRSVSIPAARVRE